MARKQVVLKQCNVAQAYVNEAMFRPHHVIVNHLEDLPEARRELGDRRLVVIVPTQAGRIGFDLTDEGTEQHLKKQLPKGKISFAGTYTAAPMHRGLFT